jgi:hypothetical protein
MMPPWPALFVFENAQLDFIDIRVYVTALHFAAQRNESAF